MPKLSVLMYRRQVSAVLNPAGVSCSAKGHIDFNWKIIMAPHHIVDYVVVHELCHLKQHDHSPEFWKLVERVIPDYANCKQWLKDNERLFVI